MTESGQAMWTRIVNFSIDEGDEAPTLARRLARENGWTEAYAVRAIQQIPAC